MTSRDGTASSTEFSSIAITDSATVSSEMIAIGRPNWTARLMVPTSRVTRVTRSPVLALSTWPSGRRRIVCTTYSRADASRSCPKSVEVRWAKKVKSACVTTTPTTSSATWSRPAPSAFTVRSTRLPSSRGTTSAVAAVSPLSTTRVTKARRRSAMRLLAKRRTARSPATGQPRSG